MVYLGGLAPEDEELSPHLRSREEVGEILLAQRRADGRAAGGGHPRLRLAVLRDAAPPHRAAAGDGDAAVGAHPHPADRHQRRAALPGRRARRCPPEVSRAFDIGGPDVLTYDDMMQRLRPPRRAAPAPHPGHPGAQPGAVQPLDRAGHADARRDWPGRWWSRCATRWCAGRTTSPTYVPDPPGGLLGFDDAVGRALQRIRDFEVPTRWSSAAEPGAPSEPLPDRPGLGRRQPVRRRARRSGRRLAARRCGGWSRASAARRGWYSFPLLWWCAGSVDRLGGRAGAAPRPAPPAAPGGRRRPGLVAGRGGGAGRLLRLRAEMRLPGLAWLELGVEPAGDAGRRRQRAFFHPHGLPGTPYWWAVPLPRPGLRRDAAQHGRGRRAAERQVV